LNQPEEQSEKQLRLLKAASWLVYVVMPIVWLLAAQFLISGGMSPKAGRELVLYLLLAVAIIEPATGLLITRIGIENYRKGKSPSKTPAHLFLSVSVFQMFMVQNIYFFGFIAFLLTDEFKHLLYFYPVGVAWSLVCWPRSEKYTRLLERLKRA
jgi:hypothetical protein